MSYNDLRRGRRSVEGQAYLLTAATFRRHSIFRDFDAAAVIAREIVRSGREAHWKLLAWVVMPDHFHLLVQLGPSSLSHAMGAVKGRSARRLAKVLPDASPIWQPGFHDRAIRGDESIKAVAWYVCCNPLRAGLVASLREYSFWDACWLPGEGPTAVFASGSEPGRENPSA